MLLSPSHYYSSLHSQVLLAQPEWLDMWTFCQWLDFNMDFSTQDRIDRVNTQGSSFKRLGDALNVRLCSVACIFNFIE